MSLIFTVIGAIIVNLQLDSPVKEDLDVDLKNKPVIEEITENYESQSGESIESLLKQQAYIKLAQRYQITPLINGLRQFLQDLEFKENDSHVHQIHWWYMHLRSQHLSHPQILMFLDEVQASCALVTYVQDREYSSQSGINEVAPLEEEGVLREDEEEVSQIDAGDFIFNFSSMMKNVDDCLLHQDGIDTNSKAVTELRSLLSDLELRVALIEKKFLSSEKRKKEDDKKDLQARARSGALAIARKYHIPNFAIESYNHENGHTTSIVTKSGAIYPPSCATGTSFSCGM